MSTTITSYLIGCYKVYISLDFLIRYGISNPLDDVEILGEYVRGMHAKDALCPNRDESLGIEIPIGKGEVDFPLLIPSETLLKKQT